MTPKTKPGVAVASRSCVALTQTSCSSWRRSPTGGDGGGGAYGGGAGGEGMVGGFDGVAAWLMELQDDGLFRKTVGSL